MPRKFDPEKAGVIMQVKPARIVDTLLVNLLAVHQHPGAANVGVNARFHVELGGEEQPYQRRMKLEGQGVDPVPLDTGWIKDVGYILITNGPPLMLGEDKGERPDVHVLGNGSWVMPPGGIFFAMPVPGQEPLRLWSAGGPVEVTINIFPR